MKKVMIFAMLALGVGYSELKAQQPAVVISDKTGWHKIGETKVDFTKDHDEVTVMGADKFAMRNFKVPEAPIDIIDVEVYYESGDNQKVNMGYAIKSPGESRTIDLNGGERRIKKMVFTYKTIPNYKDKKAHVEIWGMKTNTDKK
jgi:hypothetical protein